MIPNWLYESKWFLWSSRISFIPFRIFRGPLLQTPVFNWSGTFFADSDSKPVLIFQLLTYQLIPIWSLTQKKLVSKKPQPDQEPNFGQQLRHHVLGLSWKCLWRNPILSPFSDPKFLVHCSLIHQRKRLDLPLRQNLNYRRHLVFLFQTWILTEYFIYRVFFSFQRDRHMFKARP